MSLPDILFITAGLLILAMTAASICRHFPIPYTVLLVILGLFVNYFGDEIDFLKVHDFKGVHLTPDLVIFIFLPALVFESALSLDARALVKNITPNFNARYCRNAGFSRLGRRWNLVVTWLTNCHCVVI